jgi:hypothetical protein
MIEKTDFGDIVGAGGLGHNCGCIGNCEACNCSCNWWVMEDSSSIGTNNQLDNSLEVSFDQDAP